MKVSITKTEYTRTEKTVEVDIPERQLYLWHNGIRRAYSVKPIWTTWKMDQESKPEEMYELKVIMVDPSDNQIEVSRLYVNRLPEIVADAKHKYQRLVEDVLNYCDDGEYVRTKKQFEADLEKVLLEVRQ